MVGLMSPDKENPMSFQEYANRPELWPPPKADMELLLRAGEIAMEATER